MKLKTIPWFSETVNHPGLARGGIYLLSGQPGGGKTTLALQISCDLAFTGHKILYLALEQSPGDLKQKVEKQIFPHRHTETIEHPEKSYDLKEGLSKIKSKLETKTEEDRILQNLFVDSSINGMEALPDFLARHVLGSTAQYNGIDLIIVDSMSRSRYITYILETISETF
jgi:predicted ATP-dependent serine protease